MEKKRRVLRAAVVLAVALAAGHLVQTMKDGARVAAINAADALVLSDRSVTEPGGLPAAASLVAADSATMPDVTGITSLASRPGLAMPTDCSPTLSLAADEAAMITASFAAPCARLQRVEVRHAGLTFSARTSDLGLLAMRLPAMTADAEVAVVMADATEVSGRIAVPAMAGLRRFGLQGMDVAGFDIRVSEGDRTFASGRARQAEEVVGRFVSLGDFTVDDPVFAQIYTYPSDPSLPVDIIVEVLISADTCGRDLEAESVHSMAGEVSVKRITVPVPDCDAAGDILVLKNLAQDLTVAADN